MGKLSALLCLAFLAAAFAFQATPQSGMISSARNGRMVNTRAETVALRGAKINPSMSTDVSQAATLPAPKEFLQKVMSSRTSEKAKNELVEVLRTKRQAAPSQYEEYLDQLTAEVESVEGNKWAEIKWPIPLPSYRVKLGSFNRMLARLLDGEGGRKKAAVAALIRQLPSAKGVRALEQEAERRSRDECTMKEMLARTPEGLETPKYQVLAEKGTWEVRAYAEFSVCSTAMQNGPGAFNTLAGYIFGGNQEQQKMAMTTPVISNPKTNSMSFVMPSAYWTPGSSPPTPLPNAAVQIEGAGGGLILGSEKVAVTWFGGYASRQTTEKRKAALLEDLKADGEWELAESSAEPVLLQYNDPFQPPWKRRNEVAVAVRRKDPQAQPAKAAADAA